MSKKRIPFATGGWVNTQSSGDMPFSGEMVITKDQQKRLSDMKPKVNYKAGDDIAAAVKGASLSWTTEPETDQNTVSDDDNTQTGGNGGGNNNPPSGELEG